MEKSETRAVIKFLQLQGKSPSEIHSEMVPIFGNISPSYESVKYWCRQFKCGRSESNDLSRSGRPKTEVNCENAEKVRKIVEEDRRMTVNNIAERANLSIMSTHRILREQLCMRKITARWVPRLLTPAQKELRVQCCRKLLRMTQNDDIVNHLVTVDETWIHHFDPESKVSSMEWRTPGSPSPVKAKVTKSAGKVMLTVFWDAKGVIMTDALPHRQTMNSQYYSNLLINLRKSMAKKRRLRRAEQILLLQDNAPCHKARNTLNTCTTQNIKILPHPPYSPDLAPSDFFLFPSLKRHIKGRRFETDDAVLTASEDWLHSKNRVFYSQGLFKVIGRWHKCIRLGGDYVEKN